MDIDPPCDRNLSFVASPTPWSEFGAPCSERTKRTHARSHGVRFYCTAGAALNEPYNKNLSIQWNLYDAHVYNDGWKFGGDSITAFSMGHWMDGRDPAGFAFDGLVHKLKPNMPAFEMAGNGGWSSGTMLPLMVTYLANFPGKYYGMALGTNDAFGGTDPPTLQTYYNNMASIVTKIGNASKIAVVPTIPYALLPALVANIPAFNQQIAALYAAFPALVHGPDLWALLKGDVDAVPPYGTMFTPMLCNGVLWDGDCSTCVGTCPNDGVPPHPLGDNIHPNEVGRAAIRQAWASTMATNVYN